ncbi:unnamed protein product, partial [Sphacelaria rigidula]
HRLLEAGKVFQVSHHETPTSMWRHYEGAASKHGVVVKKRGKS